MNTITDVFSNVYVLMIYIDCQSIFTKNETLIYRVVSGWVLILKHKYKIIQTVFDLKEVGNKAR